MRYPAIKKQKKWPQLLLILLILSTLNTANAQNEVIPIKWGNVNKKEVAKMEYEAFPNAEAIILGDYGTINIGADYRLVFKRHIRVKVLKKGGLDQASIKVPFYSHKGIYTCSNIKAQSYTMEEGKVVQSKIKKQEVFTEKKDDYWSFKSFAVPNVQVGSVFEYSYTLTTKHITFLEDWVFHNEMPTLYSGFTILGLPGNLDFTYLIEGQKLIGKYQYKQGPISHWSLKNLPPLENEPMLANPMNYANKIRFQLKGYTVQSSGSDSYQGTNTQTTYKKLMSDWPQIVKKQLWGDTDFTYPFTHKKHYADDVAQVISGISDKKKQMIAVYNHCRDYFNWDGYHHIYFKDNEDRKIVGGMELGSGPINLYLTAMLREAGLEAHPVLISTRSHGKVHQEVTFLKQFNHVIVYVEIDKKGYFMDASMKSSPYNILPVKSMNEVGFMVMKKEGVWVKVPASRTNMIVSQYRIDLTDVETPKYETSMQYKGVYQVYERNMLAKMGEEEYVKSKFPETKLGATLDSSEVRRRDQKDKPLVVTGYLSMPMEDADEDADILYIPLFLEDAVLKTPFQNEKRYYPVEYPYTRSYVTTVSIEIPEGYKVDELPENKQVKLPNGMGLFDYKVTVEDQTVNVSTTVNIKKGKIKPNYYPELREFYTQIIGKFKETLVLKKVEN